MRSKRESLDPETIHSFIHSLTLVRLSSQRRVKSW